MSEGATLPARRITELLAPFANGVELTDRLIDQMSTYLDLLMRWNARVSLTSIRSPEEIVRRHFGESLFAASVLRGRLDQGAEVLDFGSGAGFPGLPLQMSLPGVRVTVAESQAKKAAFLREVVRTLGVGAEVWPLRVEEMPDGRRFDVVTMRAVDRMGAIRGLAEARVRAGGWLALLLGGDRAELPTAAKVWPIPGSEHRWVVLHHVPRGTQPKDRL